MNALEIIATVVLCIFGITIVLLWGQIMRLNYEGTKKQSEQVKKSSSENEEDRIKDDR